jgi:threonine dehydrogenase-like Zn-dependent dehydrogenase
MMANRADRVIELVAVGERATQLVARDPGPLAPGTVRVQVAYAGVCHSDLARVAEGQGPFPSRLGHEISGVVVETTDLSVPVGTRVTCYAKNGYASRIDVPICQLVPLHPGCSLLDGALAEPLACVIGGVEMLDLSQVGEVVVVGTGFMGLLAVRYLAGLGHRIAAVEPRDHVRAIATRLGAERALTPDEAPEAFPDGASVVIEATGASGGLELAGGLLRTGGTLGIMGYHQSARGRRTVDMQSWNYRGLRVLNLHHRDPHDVMRWMDRAQRSCAHMTVAPGELVDSVIELSRLPELFAEPYDVAAVKTVVRVGPPAAAITSPAP